MDAGGPGPTPTVKAADPLPATMVLGLGSWEITLVGLALLVLFGPEHAPELLRGAGRMQARAQRAMRELERAVEEDRAGDEDEVPASRDELPSSEEDGES